MNPYYSLSNRLPFWDQVGRASVGGGVCFLRVIYQFRRVDDDGSPMLTVVYLGADGGIADNHHVQLSLYLDGCSQ